MAYQTASRDWEILALELHLQIPTVTGKWVDHPSANHLGYYDPRTDCPEYAEDFNCLRPYPPAQVDEELAAKEYRKVPAALFETFHSMLRMSARGRLGGTPLFTEAHHMYTYSY